MEPLEPEIFQNGIWYELRGEQYYPCLLPPEPDHTEEMVSLESFVAGFQLAAGIARETTRSIYSFAEAEEARAGKQE